MTAYVVIPGIDGSGEQHWQTLWEREWGAAAVRIAPASWSEPEFDDWLGAVQNAYDDAARRDDQVVLVAHSLGCWAVAGWLARTSQPVAAAFQVAVPDPAGPEFPRQAAASFVDLVAQPLRCRALVVASTDDPYCRRGRGRLRRRVAGPVAGAGRPRPHQRRQRPRLLAAGPRTAR